LKQTLTTCSEQETEALGRALGEHLFPGAVILLNGELGAGKTVFARGVARGLGVEATVQSPTFTLLNAHTGRLPFYHFDLYRLETEGELYDLGFDEVLDGDGVSLVEWAGKFSGFFSMPALQIEILGAEGPCRQITFTAAERKYEKIVHDLSFA
jgi:tRNA threonylcarbamoyladenosine biosynthesis protein TsaE